MTARYYVLAHVRPDGSEGQYDPFNLAVNADDEDSVLKAAKDAAKEMGWDCDHVEIIRREDLNSREQRAATIIERIKLTQDTFTLQMETLIRDIERLARLP